MSDEQADEVESEAETLDTSEPNNNNLALQPAFQEISLLDLKPSERPWKRQPNESAVAYFAFTKYLEMGVNRSHDALAEIFPRSKTQIHNYSTNHDWVERARWYDDYMAELAQSKLEDAVARRMEDKADLWAERAERIRENAYQMSLELMSRAAEMLEAPLFEEIDISEQGDQQKTIIRKPTGWRIRDAALMTKTAAQLQWLAANMGTNGGNFEFDPKTA